MDEVADTCRELGLPEGMGRGAAELFTRWDAHRDQTRPELDQLLDDPHRVPRRSNNAPVTTGFVRRAARCARILSEAWISGIRTSVLTASTRRKGSTGSRTRVESLGLLARSARGRGHSRSAARILQGLDAAGKDGTIKSVLTGVNPQGCRIVSFKAPDGDRARPRLPLARSTRCCRRAGELGIFNRSHYEDVVAVRIRELAPANVWRRRYRAHPQLRAHARRRGDYDREGLPATSRRTSSASALQERIDDPGEAVEAPAAATSTTGSSGPVHEAAYEDVIRETPPTGRPGTSCRPTTTGSGTRCRGRLLVETLSAIDPQLPSADRALDGIEIVPALHRGLNGAEGGSNP